jgi:hypothetical protein
MYMAETHHSVYFEVRDALASPGCCLCSLAIDGMRHYLDSLGYERVNDTRMREALRAAWGFCEVHGRMLRESHDALGTALIHRDVIGAAMEALAGAQYRSASLGDLVRQAIGVESSPAANGGGDPLARERPCPACEQRATMDRTHVATLLEHLTEEDLLPAFRVSAGLCLPHLRLALRHAPDESTIERLKAAQLAIWQALNAELDEFVRKRDYRFAAEEGGTEGTSWSRAIELISGGYGLGCDSWDTAQE